MINRDRLTESFLELVRIDSLSKKERDMADHLLRRLREMGLEPYEDDTGSKIGGDAGNVICRVPGIPGKPVLLLMAHMDTVDPGIGKKPVVDGDLIRSDGTTVLGGDDAAGIAVILETIDSLKEDGISHGDLYLVFTVAEEGGLFGARNLDISKIPADYAFILDDEGPIATAAIKAPFYNRFKATFKGRAAHAGLEPEKGLNAIILASRALSGMPHMGRIDEVSTSNIGIISGGIARNIVSETCTVEGEVRSIHEDRLEQYTKEILDHIREVTEKQGGRVEIEVERMYPGYDLEESSPIICLLKDAAQKAGLPLNLHATGGGSDTNVINGYGIPAVDISVGMDRVHSTEERIRISDMEKACHFLQAIITTALTYNQ
ncbi:MAG: M20/M25/M40 family metallo-hydrolase [Clostridiaceae bacterium]|nr:M20/M25/M40 family metallo-hydrolase [Bacillota bacterium]NLI38915.1 M20/M25/M40 family metallo-hydrolase [Clostridiaceae bacterium]